MLLILLLLQQLLLLHLIAQFLLLREHILALQEPFGVALDVALGRVKCRVTQIRIVFTYFELLLVQRLILFVHFPHLLNLVQVNDETALIRVVLLNAFAAEDRLVVRTIKMLHPLVMPFAYQAVYALLVLEVYVPQNRIPLHQLV